MPSYHFYVPGAPQGKARARTVRDRSGRVHSYTPKNTRDYEQIIRESYGLYGGKMFPADTPLEVSVTAVFPVPTSYPKKVKQLCYAGKQRPLKKPDADNILKSVLDGLEGVCYYNDTQVYRVDIEKRYENEPGSHGLYVTVRSKK